MGKIDVKHLKNLSKAHFRIEMGMKNHEHVPELLVIAISKINKRLVFQAIRDLVKLKMIYYTNTKDKNGYNLTFFGYDALSLRALILQNAVTELGSQIGIGKESDVYVGRNEAGERIILKFHRLGRSSFRKIVEKRDYLCHRQYASWIYLSRLSATKEYQFMTVLRQEGFPVPVPIAHNRHCVVMSLIDGFLLNQLTHLDDPTKCYNTCRDLIINLAERGLIHCDFNEFNLFLDQNNEIYMIDFPQMVSIDHVNSNLYFNRDFECIKNFFEKRFKHVVFDDLSLSDIQRISDIDNLVGASGCKNSKAKKPSTIFDITPLPDSSVSPPDESITEINELEKSLNYLEVSHDISQITIPNQTVFSVENVRSKVIHQLAKQERKDECSNAVKNSKKSRNNYKSRQLARDLLT